MKEISKSSKIYWASVVLRLVYLCVVVLSCVYIATAVNCIKASFESSKLKTAEIASEINQRGSSKYDGFQRLTDSIYAKVEVRLAGEEDWQPAAIVAGWQDVFEFKVTIRLFSSRDNVRSDLDVINLGIGSYASRGIDILDYSGLEPIRTADDGNLVELDLSEVVTCRINLLEFLKSRNLLALWIKYEGDVNLGESELSKSFKAGEHCNWAYVVPNFTYITDTEVLSSIAKTSLLTLMALGVLSYILFQDIKRHKFQKSEAT